MTDLPTVVSAAGLVPQTPVAIQQALLAALEAQSPGYTARLPGLLVEDIADTDVAAIVMCDQARVETVDSLTPRGANAWLLAQLGAMFGIHVADVTNTTVQVVFFASAGTVVPAGFLVSDGTYTYACANGGIVGSGGQSDPLYCVAISQGIWAVPPGTVTEVVTEPSSGVVVTCANPYAGVPGLPAESETSYRTRVLRAQRAAGLGTPSYLKALLTNVPGVQERLVAFQQQTGGGWKAIVGGGDPYAVAYAILQGVTDVSTLVGSTMLVTNITSAFPGVVTTLLNHGYASGQAVKLTGVQGMTGINNLPLVATVITEKTFSVGVNTALMGVYTSGGVLTPNFRNNLVAVRDYPDVYQIAYVSPPPQDVTMTVLWNTSAANYVNDSAVAQLAAPALAATINAVPAGQPINVYDLESAFRDAVAPVLPSALLTRMVFEVSLNGVGTAATAGTGVVVGDPESYMLTATDGSEILVVRG